MARAPPERSRRVNIGWNDAGHVGVDAEQSWRSLHAHQVDDDRAPIATLRDVPRVPEALHQLGPGTGDTVGAPSGLGRLARYP